jgi:hypothetical protein
VARIRRDGGTRPAHLTHAGLTVLADKIDYAGKKRSAEEFHAMALTNLDGEYATVVTTQRVIEAFAR